MDHAQAFPLEALLRASLVEGVTARHLGVLAGSRPALPFAEGSACGGGTGVLRRIEANLRSREAGDRVRAILAACARRGIEVIPWGFAGYPPLLREIPDPPVVLYKLGGARLDAGGVAIVGSRAPTGPGRAFARELARDLACAGIVVTSGMARGIDAAAHRGALEGGGVTVAVLGCGVDVIYPPEAGRLRDEIVSRGAVVSEFPPGTRPLPRNFPRRNRIISGLSRAVVVAEAPERSGSLITARLALDQGREVMAVPGSPFFPHTAGSNRLLRDGAPPVSCAADVLAALGVEDAVRPAPGSPEARILAFLSRERTAGEIAGAAGIPPDEISSRLLEMELRKLLERTPGGYYKKLTDFPGIPEG